MLITHDHDHPKELFKYMVMYCATETSWHRPLYILDNKEQATSIMKEFEDKGEIYSPRHERVIRPCSLTVVRFNKTVWHLQNKMEEEDE